MIIITGGAGFIGSALVWELNKQGIDDIIIVDHLSTNEKWKNLVNLKFKDYIEKDVFLQYLDDIDQIEGILHMGACSATTEKDASFLIENNFEYTKILANFCVEKNTKFLYASSAATYGDGNQGYSDTSIDGLNPLNMYGYSKHLFDTWAKHARIDDKITGIKFFNVYGPNEYHKGNMMSLVNKAYYQIKQTGKINLFKSYLPGYKDGEQKRDFIYIKDAAQMVISLFTGKSRGGIYNIGTGKARTWNDLANAVFSAMDMKSNIEYVEMPDELKNKYQYFTEADMQKSNKAGLKTNFSLEDGIKDYVQNYIMQDSFDAYLK